jgi:hypothetical protein
MDRYLRKRPFLVISLVYTPANGAKSEMKDFATKGQWDLSEHITVEDSIKDKHLRDATVIIDIFKRALVKNRLEEKSDQEVINYYLTKYNKEVTEAIGIWMRKMGKEPETVQPKPLVTDSVENSEDISNQILIEEVVDDQAS